MDSQGERAAHAAAGAVPLLLHPLHGAARAVKRPVDPCEPWFPSSAWSFQHRFAGEGVPSLEGLQRLRDEVRDGELHFVLEDAEEQPLSFSLLSAEVRLGLDAHFQRPLLAVQPEGQGQGAAWLVLVQGSARDGARLLERLGRVGAVRADFAEHYSVHGPAMAHGGYASIYQVLDRKGKDGLAKDLVAKVQRKGGGDLVQETAMMVAAQGHPNVVRLQGLFRSSRPGKAAGSSVLLMEKCENGSVHDLVLKRATGKPRLAAKGPGCGPARAHAELCGRSRGPPGHGVPPRGPAAAPLLPEAKGGAREFQWPCALQPLEGDELNRAFVAAADRDWLQGTLPL